MSLRFATRLLFVCLLAALTSCKASPTPVSNAEVVTIDVAGMDKSVAPGDDFNLYVNGGWLKSTAIPADKPSYGISAILVDETRKRTIDLIQTAPGQIGDYYSSFMDEATIEAKGLTPLKPVSSAAVPPQILTTSSSQSSERWRARSATASPYPFAGFIIGNSTGAAMSAPGGRNKEWIPWLLRRASGPRRIRQPPS